MGWLRTSLTILYVNKSLPTFKVAHTYYATGESAKLTNKQAYSHIRSCSLRNSLISMFLLIACDSRKRKNILWNYLRFARTSCNRILIVESFVLWTTAARAKCIADFTYLQDLTNFTLKL